MDSGPYSTLKVLTLRLGKNYLTTMHPLFDHNAPLSSRWTSRQDSTHTVLSDWKEEAQTGSFQLYNATRLFSELEKHNRQI